MRELSTGEKISCWLGGTLLVLLLLAGGIYVYGWHINTNWRDDQFLKIIEWQGRRIDRELERVNGSVVEAEYNTIYVFDAVKPFGEDDVRVQFRSQDWGPLWAFL